MSWLDKLPKELKLYISQFNFDALAWFMLDDSYIYEYIKQHKEIFIESILEYEACSDLILPLFKKLFIDKFLPINRGSYTEKPFIKKYNDGYVYKYWQRIDDQWRSCRFWLLQEGSQTWGIMKLVYKAEEHPYHMHREKSKNGTPLAAYIANGKKHYYNHGKKIRYTKQQQGCIIS